MALAIESPEPKAFPLTPIFLAIGVLALLGAGAIAYSHDGLFAGDQVADDINSDNEAIRARSAQDINEHKETIRQIGR